MRCSAYQNFNTECKKIDKFGRLNDKLLGQKDETNFFYPQKFNFTSLVRISEGVFVWKERNSQFYSPQLYAPPSDIKQSHDPSPTQNQKGVKTVKFGIIYGLSPSNNSIFSSFFSDNLLLLKKVFTFSLTFVLPESWLSSVSLPKSKILAF